MTPDATTTDSMMRPGDWMYCAECITHHSGACPMTTTDGIDIAIKPIMEAIDAAIWSDRALTSAEHQGDKYEARQEMWRKSAADYDAVRTLARALAADKGHALRIAQAAHRFACDWETPCTPENCELAKALAGDPAVTLTEKLFNDEIASLAADAQRYRTALEPFAALLPSIERLNVQGDQKPIWTLNDATITQGDIRRAAAALAREDGATG